MAVDHPELTRFVIAMGAAARPTGFSRSWMEAEIAFREGGTLTPEFARHHYGVFMYPPEVIDDDELWQNSFPSSGRAMAKERDLSLWVNGRPALTSTLRTGCKCATCRSRHRILPRYSVAAESGSPGGQTRQEGHLPSCRGPWSPVAGRPSTRRS